MSRERGVNLNCVIMRKTGEGESRSGFSAWPSYQTSNPPAVPTVTSALGSGNGQPGDIEGTAKALGHRGVSQVAEGSCSQSVSLSRWRGLLGG